MSLLRHRFETLNLPNGEFSHRDHIQVAFEMLETYAFHEACYRYAQTVSEMARRASAAGKFSVTITIAFMSLIAERMTSCTRGFDAFLRENPDLLDPPILDGWYSPERLHSALGRRQFLLPDRLPRS